MSAGGPYKSESDRVIEEPLRKKSVSLVQRPVGEDGGDDVRKEFSVLLLDLENKPYGDSCTCWPKIPTF